MVLEITAKAIRQEKEIKKHIDRQEEINLSPFAGTQLSTLKIPGVYTKVTKTD